MTISTNRLTNGVMYAFGRSLAGKVAEATLPDIKAKMVEHPALGMIGTMEFPAGLEKMEGLRP